MRILYIFPFLLLSTFCFSQRQDKNWYFGTGTDGIVFNNQNAPIKVNNKYPGVGFEGSAVASDPCTGQLLFYTDGILVINSNHALMTNGGGLNSHMSGSQCVQVCKVPGTCQQYYVISNSAWDNTPGSYYYSIVDFSSNPLGQVTAKNQYIYGPNYHQAMRLIPKTNSNNTWLIGHLYNTATYHVFEITPSGFIGPVVYNFSNSGRSWAMEYNSVTRKLVNMGEDNLKVSLFDFDPTTGVLSNEQQLQPGALNALVGNFSPDGSKLYAGLAPGSGAGVLWQYDFNTSTWTNMNTCCWAHDVKTGPDGITYYIHTYNALNPLSQMLDANLSAVGNACGYSTITNPGNFNGEVRRFPEFLQVPDPPVADLDTVTYAGGSVTINVLANDYDPQSDTISLSAIISPPNNGSAIMSNGQIIYTANSGVCNITDTIIYEIVDNTCMCDTAYIIINIPGAVPVSDYNFSQQSCSGYITFSNISLNGVSYQWDFGDGSPIQNSLNAAHTYQQPGTYGVMLITTNNCGSDTLIDSVTINIGIPASASFNISQLNCSLIISFTNLSSNSTSYSWIFGDGYSDIANSPSHTYLNAGTYNVSLIASNACNSDTLTQQVIINNIPHPTILMNHTQQNCLLAVDFSSLIVNAVSFTWYFGDETSDTVQNLTHIYNAAGTYNVLLIAHGTCATDTLTNTINVVSLPQAVSQFSSLSENCSYAVNFSNQSQNAATYLWNFGDSTTSVLPNPQHVYNDTGIYVVRLISYNQCGSDTITQLVPDTFSPGHASFSYEQPVCESEVQFFNKSINCVSAYWNFGDGIIDHSINPVHGYKTAGNYTVMLYINKGSMCIDTVSMQINTEGPLEPHFYIPNCFTPNGDGLNDVFRIVSENECGSFQFFIFNRWGSLIYESNDIYSSWDGIINGSPVQDGIYCYLIKSSEYEKAGSVAVLH